MSVEEIQGLARTLTLADYLALSREVLKQGFPDLEYATVYAHLENGKPGVTLPIVTPQRPSAPSAPSGA
jgi:hypothetical protein